MRLHPVVYRKGFEQGRKERAGLPLAPAPYKQKYGSQLRKFRIWLAGWYDGKYMDRPRKVYR